MDTEFFAEWICQDWDKTQSRVMSSEQMEQLNEHKAFTIPSAAGNDAARVFIRSSGLPINQGIPAFFSAGC